MVAGSDKKNIILITPNDLPLHCPTMQTEAWNYHPKIFLPIEDAEKKEISCPYCGTYYKLDK